MLFLKYRKWKEKILKAQTMLYQAFFEQCETEGNEEALQE